MRSRIMSGYGSARLVRWWVLFLDAWSQRRGCHETLSDLRSDRPVRRRIFDAVRDHGGLGLLERDQLVGDRKISRRVLQDAAIQLSVRHRAVADGRRHRRHSLSRQADFSRGADADPGAIGFAAASLLYGSRGPDT